MESPKFGRAGGAYVKFRPEYPAALYDTVLAAAPGLPSCAADLGAGTSIATAVLARQFERVYAVEPDAVMVAAGQFAPNVAVQLRLAEDAEIPAQSCAAITCANAFYWMDGEAVAGLVRGWLAPGGVFAAWRYGLPTALYPAAQQILQQELADHWDEHRHPRLRDEDYTRRVLENSGMFSQLEVRRVENVSTLTPEQLAGFFASTSYGSAYMRGLENPDEYLADLTARLAADAAEGIPVDFGLELILAK